MCSKIKVGSNKYLKRFCGVHKRTFNLMLKVLTSIYKNLYKNGGRPSKSTIKNKLMMTLIYLRAYSTYFHIGVLFNYSESQTYKIINQVLDFLIDSKVFIKNEDTDSFQFNANSEYIIDVTECSIQRPKYNQKKYYSGKKKNHTIKIQLLIDKESKEIISFDIDAGSVHDFEVFKKTSDKFRKDIKLLADSGYQGIKDIMPEAEIPHKKTKNKDLNDQQKEFNKNLSSKRVIIEHVNRRLKIFKSIGLTYRSRVSTFMKIIKCIVLMHNYELSL